MYPRCNQIVKQNINFVERLISKQESETIKNTFWKLTFLFYSLLFLLLLAQYDSPEQLGVCSFFDELNGYELVWSDEFDGSEIDEKMDYKRVYQPSQ